LNKKVDKQDADFLSASFHIVDIALMPTAKDILQPRRRHP
jgi:hypothetical protein